MPTVRDKKTGKVYEFEWSSPQPPTREELGAIIAQKQQEETAAPPEADGGIFDSIGSGARKAFDFATQPIPWLARQVQEHKPQMPAIVEETIAQVANPGAALGHTINKLVDPQTWKRPFFEGRRPEDRMTLEQAVPSPVDIATIPAPLFKAPGMAGVLGKAARGAELATGAGMVGTGIGEMAEGDIGSGAVHAAFGGLALAPFGAASDAAKLRRPHITEEGTIAGISPTYAREGAGTRGVEAGYFGRGTQPNNADVMGSGPEIQQFAEDMEKAFGPEWPKHVLDDMPVMDEPGLPPRSAVKQDPFADVALDIEGAIEGNPLPGTYSPAGGFLGRPRMQRNPLASAIQGATSGPPHSGSGMYSPAGEFTPRTPPPRLAPKPRAEPTIEVLDDFDMPTDRTVEGGGTGALSSEELSRARRGEKYYKVTRGGQLTYYGNQPDPTKGLRSGEAVIRVRGDGTPEVAQTSGWTDNDALATFGRTEVGKSNRPKAQELPGDESPVAKSEIREGKVVGQVNSRLIRELGQNLYQGDLSSVVVKEGLQNAVDAIKKDTTGKVSVNVDSKTRTIVIQDTGVGMPPEIIKNQFVNPGESFKSEGSRGGYGIAKVALLTNADEIEVRSVAELPDGTKVESLLTGDGNRWLDPDDPMDVISVPAAPDAPTGTSVKIRLNDKATFNKSSSFMYMKDFLQNEKTGHEYDFNVDGAQIVKSPDEYVWDASKQTSVPVPAPSLMDSFDTPAGTIEFYRKGNYVETDYIDVDVFNGGLPQFTYSVPAGSQVRVPRRIQVNIKSALDTTDENYPFTPNRQQVRGQTEDFIRKYVADLGKRARAEEMARLGKILRSDITIGETGYRLVDSTDSVDKELLRTIANEPHIQKLAQIFGDGLQEAAQNIRNLLDLDDTWTDFFPTIGWSGGKWYGLNVDAKRVLGANAPKFAILIDPWAHIDAVTQLEGAGHKGLSNTRAYGEQAWGTMIHEIVHNQARSHDVQHVEFMTKLIGALARQGLKWVDNFEEAVLNDADLAGLFGKLKTESRALKEASSTENIFEPLSIQSKRGDVRGSAETAGSRDDGSGAVDGGTATAGAGSGKWTKERVVDAIIKSGGDVESVKKRGDVITWKDAEGNHRAVDLRGRIGPRNFGLSSRGRGTNPRRLALNPRSPLPDFLKDPPGFDDVNSPYNKRPKERGALTFGGTPASNTTQTLGGKPQGQRKATLGEKTADVLNISRTLKSSIDLSMPLRQAGLFTVRHPILASKAVKTMLRAMFNETNYEDFMTELHSRPNAIRERYIKSGLAITEHPKHALKGKGRLRNREEAFLSTMVDWVPGVRASNRAAVAFLNTARADLFDHLAEKFKGLDVADRDIAKYVNIVTGRAGLGKHGERMGGVLQALLFSPRFLASRIQSITHALPGSNTIGKALTGSTLLDPRLQRELQKDWIAYATAFAAVLSVAKMGGASVEVDPRSTDFLKIRFGKTRIDIGASYPQIGRVLAQLWTAEKKLPSGDITLTGGKRDSEFKKRADVAGRFARSKLNPPAGLLATAYAGRNYVGEPFDTKNKHHWMREAISMHSPMFLTDLADSVEEHGLAKGALFAVPSLVGGSTDVYDPENSDRLDPEAFERRVRAWRKSRVGKIMLEE